MENTEAPDISHLPVTTANLIYRALYESAPSDAIDGLNFMFDCLLTVDLNGRIIQNTVYRYETLERSDRDRRCFAVRIYNQSIPYHGEFVVVTQAGLDILAGR